MKLAEIAAKNDKELKDLITQTRQQLVTQMIDGRTKQVANVKLVHATKLQLARALTVARQRQTREVSNG